jgi:hypothetical protein
MQCAPKDARPPAAASTAVPATFFVVAQVALALVLLIASSLMVRTFNALHHVDPGFTGAAQLQTFRVVIPEATLHTRLTIDVWAVSVIHFVEMFPASGSGCESNSDG